MTDIEVLNILTRCGINHHHETGFSAMLEGVYVDSRIVCAEAKTQLCFLLCGEGANWFLGLLSGVCFRIGRPETLEALVVELASGTAVPKGKVPFGLPADFQEKHGLQVVEVIAW